MSFRIFFLGIFLLCGHAHGATWHFTDATLDSGHPITGSFEYSELHGYLNIDIQATTVTYTNILQGNDRELIVYGYIQDTIFAGLKFVWDAPLTDAGGVVNILHEQSWRSGLIDPNDCSADQAPLCSQLGAGGSVSAVPLPAAAWLFVSAIGGLAFLKRTRFAGAL